MPSQISGSTSRFVLREARIARDWRTATGLRATRNIPEDNPAPRHGRRGAGGHVELSGTNSWVSVAARREISPH